MAAGVGVGMVANLEVGTAADVEVGAAANMVVGVECYLCQGYDRFITIIYLSYCASVALLVPILSIFYLYHAFPGLIHISVDLVVVNKLTL
jgi:hypothetical protein